MPEYGPQTDFGQKVFMKKYAGRGEDFRDVCNRVASGLADSTQFYHPLREILLSQRFVPAGRILASIGTSRTVCSHNCFVSGTIEDSFVDGPGSIMERATEAAATMRMGGGIGYDFSGLRPRGATVKRLDSTASGPVSFMHIFNAICLATCSAGHRRGAQMGILRVDHPDIEEFIHAKQNAHDLTGFNISVAITDKFMRAIERGDTEFPLTFRNEVYRVINPLQLWEQIMRSAWDWAEPGVVFIDKMNQWNNLQYCETIAATNPCSEQPLPPYGACLLGSFNLARYMVPHHDSVAKWHFDGTRLASDIPHIVRAMDNVNDVARYPLEAQMIEAKHKRRMGLGVMGLANAIEAMGLPYGSEGFIGAMHAILGMMANAVYIASTELAREKGPFPLFDAPPYMGSSYIKGLAPRTQALIAEHGIRNSHLISFAPTGTIALTADNVSSGIEPVFALRATNRVNFDDTWIEMEVEDYGHRVFGTKPRIANEVTADEHIAVLATAQRYSDSAVSKTCNIDGSMPWDEFKALYHKAWRLGAKSCSVFNRDGKRMAALVDVAGSDCKSGTCDV